MIFNIEYESIIIILLILSIIFLIWCFVDKNKKEDLKTDNKINKKRKNQASFELNSFDDENINNIF